MSYTIEKLPGERIVFFTAHDDYRVTTEFEHAVADAVRLLDAQHEPVAFFQDLRRQPTPNVDELMVAGQALARGAAALYRHPMVGEVITVTADEIMRAAYEGLDSEIFGNLHVEIFETLDAALAYARRGG